MTYAVLRDDGHRMARERMNMTEWFLLPCWMPETWGVSQCPAKCMWGRTAVDVQELELAIAANMSTLAFCKALYSWVEHWVPLRKGHSHFRVHTINVQKSETFSYTDVFEAGTSR